MATRTLNQLRAEIQLFARQHGQIRTGKFRALPDLLSDGDIEYPAMYYMYTGSQKNRNVLRVTLQIGIGSRALPEWTNVPEIWSDCEQIACDLLAYFDSAERPYKLIEGTQITPFEDANPDLFAGVLMNVTLELGYPYDRCIIPLKPDGFLITEDGATITTEAGNPIALEYESEEDGEGITTEDNYTLTTENGEPLIS